jgi:hypothetical protein
MSVTKHIERRAVAELDLLIDLLLDLVHGHVAGAFDHDLDIVLPRLAGKLAQRLQLSELRFVGCIGNTAGTQAVAERVAHVVLRHHLRDAVEVLIEEVLLVVRRHPLRKDCAATADDAGDALRNHGNVLHQYARMNRKVIHALLCLLLDDF